MHAQTNAPDVVTHYMLRDSNVLQENSNVKYVTNLDISLQYVIRKANSHQVPLKQENPKHSNFVQGPYTPTTMLTEVDLKHQTLKTHSAYRWKYKKSQVTNQQVPKPIYLMTNLAYHLQIHHKRNHVSQGMIRHMCRCESDANGHVLPNVQRLRSEKTHFL